MPETIYTYIINNSKAHIGALQLEITASSINTIIKKIDAVGECYKRGGTALYITFSDTLSTLDKTTLDDLISSYKITKKYLSPFTNEWV